MRIGTGFVNTFRTSADVLGAPPTTPSSPRTGPPARRQDLVGSDIVPLRGTLAATISAAGRLNVELDGKGAGRLPAGRYRISVTDMSATRGCYADEGRSARAEHRPDRGVCREALGHGAISPPQPLDGLGAGDEASPRQGDLASMSIRDRDVSETIAWHRRRLGDAVTPCVPRRAPHVSARLSLVRLVHCREARPR